MSRTISSLFIGMFVALGLSPAAAQDPVFSQFFAAPLQLNPAFTGITYAPRVTLNYRNQWPSWPNAFVTYAATYEHPLEELNSGLGLLVMSDNAGDGIYRTNRLRGFYGYKVALSSRFFVQFGVEAGFIQTRLDWDRLVFLDQLDPLTGAVDSEGRPGLSSEQRPERLSRTILDLGAGLLVYSGRIYGGVSVKHMNRPEDNLLDVNENLVIGLPLRLSIHGGLEIPLEGGNNGAGASFISPNIMYTSQSGHGQIMAGAYAGLGKVFAGGWYRATFENPDAAVVMAGLRHGVFRIGYSYDITVSQLGNAATGGTHEVSLTISFEDSSRFQAKKQRERYSDCFKMFN